METCCSQLGNGTLFVQDECFVWCDVDDDNTSGFDECLFGDGNFNGNKSVTLSCDVAEGVRSSNGNGDDDDGDDDSDGNEESAGVHAYHVPRATFSALFCSVLALGVVLM